MVNRDRVIFGCVNLTMHENKKSALNILNEAYNEGIVHFDVARLYGGGFCEEILGEFIFDKRDKVKVTTKFGLNPEEISLPSISTNNILKIKKIIKHIPFVENIIKKKLRQKSDNHFLNLYSSSEAKKSIEKSLRALKTTYIDCILLHEADIYKANNLELINYLKDLKNNGIIKQAGIGSDFSAFYNKFDQINEFYQIFQFENSIVKPNLNNLNIKTTCFTHSIYKHLPLIKQFLAENYDIAENLCSIIDLDINVEKNLCGFLLVYAINKNNTGKVIFSTKDPLKLKSNLAIADKIILNAEDLEAIDNILFNKF